MHLTNVFLCQISYDELRAGKISFPAAFEEERSTVGSFMEALDNACRVMLMSLSASLGLQDTDSLAKFHEQSDTSETGLKFISEPTLARVADVGDNLHTDGGTFTVLFYEKLGLQSYFPCKQQWAFIPPMEGCCVVNVADSLARFSNGKMHSPKHRVTQTEDGAGERFYLSYFLRPGHKWLSK
jgi:isopenicillin N synthase-like dioxygenase